jgi:beta-lactamase regulating signal transducer with metallopeptidase domain
MVNYVYLLKVVICSAVLLGYYFIALRNKVYHQYNRIYLLLSVIASWLIPALSFNFLVEEHAVSTPIYKVINYASNYGNANTAQTNSAELNTETSFLSMENIAYAIFCIVCLYFLMVLLASFYKIYSLKKKYKAHHLDHCTIYLTNEKYTPYSFLDIIFWNKQIDLSSKLGQQILQHELVHVREKHSLDKIFIQVNLIIGWFNPFFWLVKAELEMIHEFIADEKSIPNADVSEFASMILSVNEVNKHLPLTNPFFFSPIKRRLQMLTKQKSLRFSYLQRVLALPVFVILVVLLSLKSKQTFAQIQNFLPATTFKKATESNTAVKETSKPKSNAKKEKLIINNATVRPQFSKDSTEETIDDLQKQYQAMELQYKKETAIARERKKLMLLIQKQDLSEEKAVELFKMLVKVDGTTSNKSSQRQLQQALVPILGKEKLRIFLQERTEIHEETEAFLNN